MEEQRLLKRKRKALNENNQTLLQSVCADLAELYVKEGHYHSAIKEYEALADVYKEEGKPLDYARANRCIGEAYMGLQNFEKALEYQKLYLNVATVESDELEQQRALATIGHIYLTWYLETQTDKSKLNTAFKHFMKSLAIAENLTCVSKQEKADMTARLFSNLGLVKESLSDYDKALQLFEQCISICKQHDIYEQLYRSYSSMAALYEKKSEYNEAIRHYNLAIDAAKKVKDHADFVCAALLMKSDALVKLADFHGAKQVLLKAYKLKTPNVKDKRLIERNLRIVAAMCSIEDKLVMACDDERERKELYEKMGDGACDLKNYSKGLEYYKLMLECAERSGCTGRELASCYYSLAETYKDNEQFDEALEYFDKEYALCLELTDRLNTLSKIADTKEAGGASVEEVKEVYSKAIAECRRSRNLREEKRMVNRCISYLRRVNSNSAAYEMAQYLKTLGDTSFEDDSSSSENESENSEAKPCIGDDINLDAITDDSGESDVENQPCVGRKRRGRGSLIKKNVKGESKLHTACIEGSLPVVHHLVEQGHPVNVRDNSGWLPLHEACNYGHVDVVRYLLDKGASVNDRGGLHCNGESQICSNLRVVIYKTLFPGVTPLYDAAGNGHLKVVELLLDTGASVAAKTDDGDTPLNILMQWHKDNPLEGEELRLYRSLIKRMSEAMERAGQGSKSTVSVHAPPPSSPYSQRLGARVSQPDRTSRALIMEEDAAPALEASGVDAAGEYKKVMNTLRTRTNSTAATSPCSTPASTRSVALVPTSADDWLEDDMQASKAAKKRKTSIASTAKQSSAISRNRSKSPSPILVPDLFPDVDFDDDVVMVQEPSPRRLSNDSTSSAGGVKRKHQVSLLDAGFSRTRSPTPGTSMPRSNSFERRPRPQQPKITTFGHRSFAEADSTVPIASPVAPAENIADEILYADVKVEGMTFRVPVLSSQVRTNTIGWLAEQAALKYAKKEGTKLTLELETVTGVLLSNEDPLGLLFSFQSRQPELVIGKVVERDLPCLVDRYKETSRYMKLDVEDSLCHLLEEMSVTLNLANRGLLGKTLAPLFKSLTRQSKLLELDLSGNFLDTRCFLMLCSSLPTLENLATLSLRCTGLQCSHLAEFARMLTTNSEPVLGNLSVLNLSDNSLRDHSLPHLSRITAHLKLADLNLSNVKFTNKVFDDFNEERCRLNLSRVQCLDLSDNELRAEDIARFLRWTTPSQLVDVNVSRNADVGEGVLRSLLDVLMEDVCGAALRSLNLSRCQVQDMELYDLLRTCSGNTLQEINLSYNTSLTGISLRRLLECASLKNINLMGCDNILRYFNDCDLLGNSRDGDEKVLKLSADFQSYQEAVQVLVVMFKRKYKDCYMEKTQNFLLLSSKK
ncbi:hypothetical protein NQ315_001291 [Exocentrus adspersus]|uniref:Tonsoku-like protein n=1 Tax=Exocentrus adspersus TaxID=1586481 RepID=A0AAV8WG38_9CUCU|nr:hypothetical protein NQ315_001291 [Exocentrus adspersus]